MKNGVIEKKDGDTLIDIYNAFDLDGNQKRPLTCEELVLIFSIGKKIRETIGALNMPESIEEAMEYIKGYCMKHPYCDINGNVCRLYEKNTGRCFLCSDIIPADWEIDNGGKDGDQ